jgi:hypothetical protein
MAGITGTDSTLFKSVATKAMFGIYGVFGCSGLTSTTVVLEALKLAIAHKMHIITMPETSVINQDLSELGIKIEEAVKENIIILVVASNNNILGMDDFSYIGLPVSLVSSAKLPYKWAHWFTEVGTNRCIDFTSYRNNMNYNLGDVSIALVGKPILNNPRSYSSGLHGKVLMLSEKGHGTLKLINFAKVLAPLEL